MSDPMTSSARFLRPPIRSRRGRKQSGFTLIELIVVVIILAIMTGLATISYYRTRDDGTAAQRDANVTILNQAHYRAFLKGIGGAPTALWDKEDALDWYIDEGLVTFSSPPESILNGIVLTPADPGQYNIWQISP